VRALASPILYFLDNNTTGESIFHIACPTFLDVILLKLRDHYGIQNATLCSGVKWGYGYQLLSTSWFPISSYSIKEVDFELYFSYLGPQGPYKFCVIVFEVGSNHDR